jgi:hypothetical protein
MEAEAMRSQMCLDSLRCGDAPLPTMPTLRQWAQSVSNIIYQRYVIVKNISAGCKEGSIRNSIEAIPKPNLLLMRLAATELEPIRSQWVRLDPRLPKGPRFALCESLDADTP